MNRNLKIKILIVGVFFNTYLLNAQTELNSNYSILSNQSLIQSYKWDSKIIPYLGETSILFNTGHVNSWYKDYQLNAGQSINNPIQTIKLRSFKKQELETKTEEIKFANAEIQKQWVLNCLEFSYLSQQIVVIHKLFNAIELADSTLIKRIVLGLNSNVDRLSINLLRGKLVLQMQKLNSNLINVKSNLLLLNPDLKEFPDSSILFNLDGKSISILIPEFEQRISIQEHRIKSIEKLTQYEQSSLFPRIQFGFTQQSFKGYQTINSNEVFFNNDKPFHSIQIGLSAPLFTNGYIKNKTVKFHEIQSEKLKLNALKLESSIRKSESKSKLETSANTIRQHIPSLIELLKMSEEMIHVKLSQQNIDPMELARIIEQQAELSFSINEAYYLFQLDLINQKLNP